MCAPRYVVTTPIYVRRHSKFGFGWLMLTILSGGLLLPFWLMSHTNELVSVDRVTTCSHCRQVVS